MTRSCSTRKSTESMWSQVRGNAIKEKSEKKEGKEIKLVEQCDVEEKCEIDVVVNHVEIR